MFLHPTPLFFSVCMDNFKALNLTAFWGQFYRCCVCWSGRFYFPWPWNTLCSSRIIGRVRPAASEVWFFSLHFGVCLWRSLMRWKLASCVYGLVSSPRKSLRLVSLVLYFLIGSPALICFVVWVCLLFFWILLQVLHFLGILLSVFGLLSWCVYYSWFVSTGVLFFIASWLMLPWLWVLYWILLPMGQANGSANCALVPFKLCMDVHLNLALPGAPSPPRIMVGCDDRAHRAHPLIPTHCWWGTGPCCKSQRFWARQLLYLNAMFVYGITTTKSLMRLITEHAEARIVISVTWAPPSLLLSLLLVTLYAHNPDYPWSGFCWRLVHLQNEWDEVKGLCPLVYEDNLSEARMCRALGLCLNLVASSFLFCWQSPFVQPDWELEQGQGLLSYVNLLAKEWLTALVGFFSVLWPFDWCVNASTRLLPPSHSMRPEIQQQERNCMLGMLNQLLDHYTLMCRLYFGMYWGYNITLPHLQIVVVKLVNSANDDFVSWSTGCTILLFPHLNMSVVWTITQLCCVIGPCLRALDWHLRMLGPACNGLSDASEHVFFPFRWFP